MTTMATITCPHCRREIPLDEVLTHQIREDLERKLSRQMQEREKEIATKEEAVLKREKELKDARAAQEKQLAEAREALTKELDERLALERKKTEEQAIKKASDALSIELTDLRNQVEEQGEQVKQFKAKELELRNDKRKLEQEKQDLELEVARKIDAERQKIREEAQKGAEEQHRLKDLDKEKLINDMMGQIEELKRKAEQGSQQTQGEVLELELESLLKEHFRHDTILPVPKGMRGADVIQRVCTPSGQICGTIIWESKRTKAWSDSWLEKLKEDQREAKADIAVIVTTVLPKDVSAIADRSGVWVCDYPLAVGLAMALRSGLAQAAAAKTSMVGKSEKMDMLYEYLCGPEFRQQIAGIVEAFAAMRRDLDQEKRAMEKAWAKREKQIEKVVKNTARMYGSMQGIVGASLPELKSLELKALQSKEE